jgi:hypothetical protein
MRLSKRTLSIETDPSIHLESCTHLTTTTHLTFPSTTDEDFAESSFDPLKLTTSQIALKNHQIYKALNQRLDKQNRAISGLELEKLKNRLEKVEKYLEQSQDEKSLQPKSICEGTHAFPPAPHSLVKLKSKLKEANKKKRVLKQERDTINCELQIYKEFCKEMKRNEDNKREASRFKDSHSNSCNIF